MTTLPTCECLWAHKMSRCIVKFGSSTRAFRCSEIDAIRFGADIGNHDVILIGNNNAVTNITFALDNIE